MPSGLMAPSSGGPANKPRQPPENCAGLNRIGGDSSSTERGNDVPCGTLDEGGSYVRLEPTVCKTARPPQRLFRPVLESHDGRALVPIPKRSTTCRPRDAGPSPAACRWP